MESLLSLWASLRSSKKIKKCISIEMVQQRLTRYAMEQRVFNIVTNILHNLSGGVRIYIVRKFNQGTIALSYRKQHCRKQHVAPQCKDRRQPYQNRKLYVRSGSVLTCLHCKDDGLTYKLMCISCCCQMVQILDLIHKNRSLMSPVAESGHNFLYQKHHIYLKFWL
jgi:hypothetical protein